MGQDYCSDSPKRNRAGRHSYTNGMLMPELPGKILEWIPPCEGQEDLCHTSVVLLVGLLSWESPHFVMVLYTDENSNYHIGYPMAMRSFSQVLENNVLRGPYSFDEATHTQMELAFDLVLDLKKKNNYLFNVAKS